MVNEEITQKWIKYQARILSSQLYKSTNFVDLNLRGFNQDWWGNIFAPEFMLNTTIDATEDIYTIFSLDCFLFSYYPRWKIGQIDFITLTRKMTSASGININ